MSEFAVSPASITQAVTHALGDKVGTIVTALGEVTLTVAAEHYLEAMRTLHQAPGCRFDLLSDLCGVDCSSYGDGRWEGPRYAVVAHLLSIGLNQRLRVRVYCPDDELPTIPSVMRIWASANWFEREAFDLFGIVFEGHDDLRRILTDYGFIGHPFRKDFPMLGHVEMRYDAERKRVVYEPVTIEPRENVPRIIREEQYGGLH